MDQTSNTKPADVEPVFGNIKQNKNFKRFLLRDINKVEIVLIASAIDLAKMLRKSRLLPHYTF